jgi:AcrR family transcriptional regulator
MAESFTTEPVRRHLTSRQADTVQRLVDAAVEEVRTAGYDGLSVRGVARRAGVAPATAYTYFASKDHLIAEAFWRRLQPLPPPRFTKGMSAATRVRTALEGVALLLAGEPELAQACTVGMVASDPDVKRLRDRIGAEIRHRLAAALGEGADPAALRTLELAFSGAMVQAGTGHLSYNELPDRMTEVATVVVGRKR